MARVISCTLLFVLMQLSVARSVVEYRVFTDRQGRCLAARLISYDAEKGLVNLDRQKLGSITVKVQVFSDEDQAYIKNWALLYASKPETSADKIDAVLLSHADAKVDVFYIHSMALDAGYPESGPLRFSKLLGPGWLNIASDGTISGTPTSADLGLNTFDVQVDTAGGRTNARLTINVIEAPDYRYQVFSQDPSLKNELEEAFLFTPASPNRLQNGSFELGLGAEPFHPGWAPISKEDAQRVPDFTPPAPVIDRSESVEGQSSLKLTIPAGAYRSWLYISPPSRLGPDTLRNFSFHAKTDHGSVNAKVLMNTAISPEAASKEGNHSIGTAWGRYETSLEASNAGYRLFIELTQENAAHTNRPTVVWLDAVQWLDVDKKVDIDERPELELNFLPADRRGIHWADELFSLPVTGRCQTARKLDLTFYANDASRPGVIHKVWTSQLACKRDTIFNTTIAAGNVLPRGTYVGVLVARDASDQSIVGTAQRYFSVMTDLTEVEPTEFFIGSFRGLRFNSDDSEYNWHGYWNVDEHFKLMYQAGYRAQRSLLRWSDLESSEGVFDNWFMDYEMETATSNGCTHLITLAGLPTYIMPKDYKKPDLVSGSYRGLPGWMVPQTAPVPKEDLYSGSKKEKRKELLVMPVSTSKIIGIYTNILARWGEHIDILETHGEINLMYHPGANATNVLMNIYGPIKAVSPNTKLCINVTGDEDKAPGESYTEKILAAASSPNGAFLDGVTRHAYGSALISRGMLKNVSDAASRMAGATNLSGEPLLPGLSAGGNLSEYTGAQKTVQFQGWELAHQNLANFAAGGRWCTGNRVVRGFWCIGQVNPVRRYRGPYLAPAQGAVANNAIYTVLAGAKGEGLIELDSNLMIGTFSTASHRFAALGCTHVNDVWVYVNTPLNDLENLEVFDQWGERIPFDGTLMVNKEVIYLKTTDSRLFSRLASAKLKWGVNALSITTEGNYENPLDIWKRAKTGNLNIRVGSNLADFDVLETSVRSGTPVQEGIIHPDGSQNPAAGTWTAIDPFYQNACIPMADPSGPLPGEIYTHNALYSPFPTSLDLGISLAYISKAELWVNGVLKQSWRLTANHYLGTEWLTERIGLSAGINNIVLVLTPKGNGIPVFRMRTGTEKHPELIHLTQVPGVELKQSLVAGDAPKLRTVDMWNTDRAMWLSYKNSDYNLDFTFRDHHEYPVTSYEVKAQGLHRKDCPTSFSLYASHDGAKWVLLDKQVDLPTFRKEETKVFELNTSEAYKHYRFFLPRVSDDAKGLNRVTHIHLNTTRDRLTEHLATRDSD